MNTVTIFIPVSRAEHLDRLFHSLEMLECDREHTNLLTYIDGDTTLFTKTRNLTQASKFSERLCEWRPSKGFTTQFGLMNRRMRISQIKNESKDLIKDCDYIFGIEDDTIVPTNALAKLLQDYLAYPYAGFISGVELGRWGIPYIGAWKADDVYSPERLDSLLPPKHIPSSVQEVDAAGFYCYLTKRSHYIQHDYAPFGDNALGPDVNYGIWLRQQGFTNYVDWSVSCDHFQRGGAVISLGNTTPRQAYMVKEGENWKQKIA